MKYPTLILLSLHLGFSAYADDALSACVAEVEQKFVDIDQTITNYFNQSDATAEPLPASEVIVRQVCMEGIEENTQKVNSLSADDKVKRAARKETKRIKNALVHQHQAELTQIALDILQRKISESLKRGSELIVKKARSEDHTLKGFDGEWLQEAITTYRISKRRLDAIESAAAE
ncbi:hypothetical protein [Sulfuriroseicoccus oceanibius]|uniref:Uncharacterized protein n=1 Tax=Sulfuriroseicoccus oceanibius TaxID=2707525 RepID=A0A6B3LBP9_9BACT|nr:hypothetical protein [Sulfuriroseicoccus oceanibius]QQL44557.1 hypothetical protein G3M56_011800 [Sulfuriroseicoccus oceanibius]